MWDFVTLNSVISWAIVSAKWIQLKCAASELHWMKSKNMPTRHVTEAKAA